jgi:basic membrane protein A
MMRRLLSTGMMVVVLATIVSGCAPVTGEEEAPTDTPVQLELQPTATEIVVSEPVPVRVCQVTDTAGIDDRSFNATVWQGIERAESEFGIEGMFLEAEQETDYTRNITAFVDAGCDLIVPVGFLLEESTRVAAEAYPDQSFAVVDVIFDPPFDNVLNLWYAVEQATFQAGYLAASVSQTGKVGIYGGMQFRSLEYFLDGFWLGVQYYNETHGTDVQVVGWDPQTRTGLFAGNFESTDDGRSLGEFLLDEGVDVIMPVAGQVGLGTAAAIQARGSAYLIGVDTDWCISVPDYCGIILTSVLKNMDQSVYDATAQILDGEFHGGTYVGTLENGGVGLSPFHELDSLVDDETRAELEAIEAAIIAGQIVTIPPDVPGD